MFTNVIVLLLLSCPFLSFDCFISRRQLTKSEILQLTGKTLRPFMRPPANVSAACIHYYVTHTVSFTFVMEQRLANATEPPCMFPNPCQQQHNGSPLSPSRQPEPPTVGRGGELGKSESGRKERECRCDRSPKASSDRRCSCSCSRKSSSSFSP